jgi:hypothetical protein
MESLTTANTIYGTLRYSEYLERHIYMEYTSAKDLSQMHKLCRAKKSTDAYFFGTHVFSCSALLYILLLIFAG